MRAMVAHKTQMVVPMMSKRVVTMDWNIVMRMIEGLIGLMPLTAFVKELAAGAVHSW